MIQEATAEESKLLNKVSRRARFLGDGAGDRNKHGQGCSCRSCLRITHTFRDKMVTK